jgi:hypothetical protein
LLLALLKARLHRSAPPIEAEFPREGIEAKVFTPRQVTPYSRNTESSGLFFIARSRLAKCLVAITWFGNESAAS